VHDSLNSKFCAWDFALPFLVTLSFIFVFLCSQELYLFHLGGRDWKEAVRFCGAALLSPLLQGQYNLTGQQRGDTRKAAFNSIACVKNSIYSEYSIYMKVCVNGSVSK
jgi:hypothetical protein